MYIWLFFCFIMVILYHKTKEKSRLDRFFFIYFYIKKELFFCFIMVILYHKTKEKSRLDRFFFYI